MIKMKGIYKYTDLKNGDVVYIGKDSHIDKNRRHKQHLQPFNYDEQPINRILQNNRDRYEYSVLWVVEDCSTLKLNKMEILFGKIYNPKFNFDKFGKGGSTRHTEQTKQKMSEAHKGKPKSEEHKRNLSKALKDKPKSEEHKQKISESKTGVPLPPFSEEHKLNISKAKNKTGYYRVSKQKNSGYKQGFCWVYNYSKEGKRKHIKAVSVEELEDKVKSKGLQWVKL